MQVSVRQENLARGLGIVGRSVESRPTLPVLGNVLLKTGDARLQLAAIDMSLGMSVTCWIGARIEEEGSITLPRNTLTDLVNSYSPERVDLKLDNATRTVWVHSGDSKYEVRGIDAGEFPLLPQRGEADVTMPARTLRDMITQTVFATAREDNRPVLTGVFTEFKEQTMTMAAADGYRLAVRTCELGQEFGEPRTMVIPGRALAEVARIIGDSEQQVQISFPGERDIVLFQLDHVLVSAQLLEDRFPDFAAVIPTSHNTSAAVYTGELRRICRRVAVFARDASGSARIQVRPASETEESGEMIIAGKSNERGGGTDTLHATVEGEELDISLNVDYLIDALNVIPDERIVLESSGPPGPGVLKAENRDDFVHVIMPMARTH